MQRRSRASIHECGVTKASVHGLGSFKYQRLEIRTEGDGTDGCRYYIRKSSPQMTCSEVYASIKGIHSDRLIRLNESVLQRQGDKWRSTAGLAKVWRRCCIGVQIQTRVVTSPGLWPAGIGFATLILMIVSLIHGSHLSPGWSADIAMKRRIERTLKRQEAAEVEMKLFKLYEFEVKVKNKLLSTSLVSI